MERRGFLTGLMAGGIGWLGAGARRHGALLQPAYAHPIPISENGRGTDAALFQVDAQATSLRQSHVFPQSVASGDPNPNGIVLWTRVEPSAVGGFTKTLAWQIATDKSFGDGSILLEGTGAVTPARDHTVALPLQNPALQPFSLYYYRFIADGVASRTGQFKTLPAPGDSLSQLRVGLVNCQDYSNGFYNAYGAMAKEELDVVVFLGDYIYEYLNDGVGGPDNGPVRVVPPYPLGGDYPQGLPDYRHLYKTYRADPQIQAAHENFAFILLWDDHEFFNDCHQVYHEDTNPPGESATTPQPALRRAATRAWSEYTLAAVPYQPEENWRHEITIYRSFEFGSLMKLVVTDERLYRDGPPCGDVDIGERYETPGCAAQASPDRTMLGTVQRQWFLNQVTGSTARWTCWANEVMLAQYKFGPPLTPEILYFDLDAWDGYQAERASLLSTIADAKVRNFVALSGDAHLYMAAYLKLDYDAPATAPVGVEFLVGAVSSGNYADAGVDSNGTPASAPKAAHIVAAARQPFDTLEPVILEYNPHMVFWNGASWGYAVLDITPDAMRCAFRSVSTVKGMPATVGTLAKFRVPDGKIEIIAD